ncbi:MAG: hypothetical protein U0L71_05460 [Eggerthellaceae bacterium]|nr:hypothetical protein [Eggerthellaceae bacterium]
MKKDPGNTGEQFPQPVFIAASYDEQGVPNAMNVAWSGEKRFIGEIVNTRVDDSILDDEGHVDFDKMRPIVYDSARCIYRVVGEGVGGAWEPAGL